MNWNRSTPTFVALEREARRIRACKDVNDLNIDESDVFSRAIYEVAHAVAQAQQYPYGRAAHLSAECIELFAKAARMAETERRESSFIFTSLEPIAPNDGAGEVVDFPDRPTATQPEETP